jgi:hypothetical protein
MTGSQILVLGWLGPAMLQFGWFANLAMPAAVYRLLSARRETKLDILLAIVLSLLASDALLWRDIHTESGTIPVVAFASGFYAWLIAMFGASATVYCSRTVPVSPSERLERSASA